MVRTRSILVLLACTLSLLTGCSTTDSCSCPSERRGLFSRLFQRNQPECCEVGAPICCEGPALGDYGPPMGMPPAVNGAVPPAGAVPPGMTPVPAPRLVPQPQSQPQPYTPSSAAR